MPRQSRSQLPSPEPVTEPEGRLYIDYLPLSDLLSRKQPRNPKEHDIGALSVSVNHFGFAEPPLIDEKSGALVAGHGRLDTLAILKARGQGPPPKMVHVIDGEWLVPVIRGLSFKDRADVERYLITSNRLTILGGWNEPELVASLQRLQELDAALLPTTGFDAQDLQRLLADLNGYDNTYTRKIVAPTYEPSPVKPTTAALVDTSKRDSLIAQIDQSDLPEDEKYFLRLAAQRHVIFNYSLIADFYAHSEAPVQALMEESALVILDLDRAIELGFVQVTERIAQMVKEDYGSQ